MSKYPIPQNPSKPTVILNITGKMAIVLACILAAGLGLAVLVNSMAMDAKLPDIVLILIAIAPAAIYLLLYYPLPDGRRLIDWIRHIIRFYRVNQTYYFRRTRR